MLKTHWTADVGSNHNMSLDRAIDLIGVCSLAGFNAVKFQLLDPDRLSASGRVPNHRIPPKWWKKLAEECHAHGLELQCSLFHPDLLDEAAPYVDSWKISSYDLLRTDLISVVAATQKPVTLSCGHATREEIEAARQLVQQWQSRAIPTFLHCVSEYPCDPSHAHLSTIKHFGLDGWSDHSGSPAVVAAAVLRFGARYIELHFDLDDHQGDEFRHGHCWDCDRAHALMTFIDQATAASWPTNMQMIARMNGQARSRRADPATGLRP